ncbi:hypothetical protein KSP39_PZI016904 [Platanthera zijinensis]|uniref:Uncharacterized protein n=1 Tax=Platanthera zijinensis TaxID=2320716 RepID=A0AAP0G0E2_9ASPA
MDGIDIFTVVTERRSGGGSGDGSSTVQARRQRQACCTRRRRIGSPQAEAALSSGGRQLQEAVVLFSCGSASPGRQKCDEVAVSRRRSVCGSAGEDRLCFSSVELAVSVRSAHSSAIHREQEDTLR